MSALPKGAPSFSQGEDFDLSRLPILRWGHPACSTLGLSTLRPQAGMPPIWLHSRLRFAVEKFDRPLVTNPRLLKRYRLTICLVKIPFVNSQHTPSPVPRHACRGITQPTHNSVPPPVSGEQPSEARQPQAASPSPSPSHRSTTSQTFIPQREPNRSSLSHSLRKAVGRSVQSRRRL